MKKIKKFIKENPEDSIIIGSVVAGISLLTVAVIHDVKRMKKTNAWIEEHESQGHAILMDELGRLVAAENVVSVWR